MPKQIKSEELMFSRIREWRESGLSQKAFCEQWKITYSSFHYWYRRFRNVDPHPTTGFLPLQVSSIDTSIFASVNFAKGDRIQLHQAVSPEYIKELLK